MRCGLNSGMAAAWQRHELRVALRIAQQHGPRHGPQHELAGKEQVNSTCVGILNILPRGASALFSQRPEKAALVADKRKCTPNRAATN